MKVTPIISVIVPCYNQAQYMPEALQSLLDQDFQDWECIIVNDGSPDNTEEVANQWVEKDTRFRYYSKENTGVCDTRNYAVSKSRGEYIVPLDGDDKLAPTYFSEAVNVLKNNPKVRLVYSDGHSFGNESNLVKTAAFDMRTHLISNQIHNSACFRKSIFIERGGYNLNMAKGLEDWDLWVNIIDKNEDVVKLDGFHCIFRVSDVSRSTEINEQMNEDLLMQIFRNHTEKYLKYLNPIRDKLRAILLKDLFDQVTLSDEMKVGRLFYYPIHKIRKLLGMSERLKS